MPGAYYILANPAKNDRTVSEKVRIIKPPDCCTKFISEFLTATSEASGSHKRWVSYDYIVGRGKGIPDVVVEGVTMNYDLIKVRQGQRVGFFG
jgi:hypothetical protein